MITITVIGTPQPQGSKKFVGMSKAGRGILVEDNRRNKPWREAVVYAAMESKGRIEGAVMLDIDFTLPRPKSAPKTRKVWPDKKPDIDKLIRSVNDALSAAGVWEDDARIVSLIARKLYVGDRDAQPVPGAVIRIEEAWEGGT
jgi:Holliday junction resolvase RusA-like endonuclease